MHIAFICESNMAMPGIIDNTSDGISIIAASLSHSSDSGSGTWRQVLDAHRVSRMMCHYLDGVENAQLRKCHYLGLAGHNVDALLQSISEFLTFFASNFSNLCSCTVQELCPNPLSRQTLTTLVPFVLLPLVNAFEPLRETEITIIVHRMHRSDRSKKDFKSA